MATDHDKLDQIERTQEELRERIATPTRLAEKAARLLKRHRQTHPAPKGK